MSTSTEEQPLPNILVATTLPFVCSSRLSTAPAGTTEDVELKHRLKPEVIKYEGPPIVSLATLFWQPAPAEQKREDLILITQISGFILLIKISDKDLV